MLTIDFPLVVCLTPDVRVRERVARRLSDCGVVVMCADLAELRAVFCPAAQVERLSVVHPTPPVAVSPPRPVHRQVADEPAGESVSPDLVIDPDRHVVTWRGTQVPVTRLEWELLCRLATLPVTVWTYKRLFEAVWGGTYLGDSSILHSAMKRLRRKLREAGGGISIETIRGVGYRLVA